MNQEYDPIIAARLIESAAPDPNPHAMCEATLEFAADSAAYWMASSDRFERKARCWRAVAWALGLALAAVVIGRVWR